MTALSRKAKISIFIILFITISCLLTFSSTGRKKPHNDFPYSVCKAELKINDFKDNQAKVANIRIFLLFKDGKSGNIEFSGNVSDDKKTYLTRGRIDFNYQFSANVLELTSIKRMLSERDMTTLMGAILPEYLSVNHGSITFTTRMLNQSQVLITRYNEPLYILTCH